MEAPAGAGSSLSPPVEQLLVAPVRHLLGRVVSSSASSSTEEPKTDAVSDGQLSPSSRARRLQGGGHQESTTLARGWLTDDGLLNWGMFASYELTSEESASDEVVMERMRAILQEKIAVSQAPTSQSASATSISNDKHPSQEGHTQQTAQQKKGQGQPKGKKGGAQPQKKKGGAAGGSNAASDAMEREIAELEAEESKQQMDAVDEAKEKKLSEEARAYDITVWEDIVQTALLLQKASEHVHRYMVSLSEAEFINTYAHHFSAFHEHAPEFPLIFRHLKEGKAVEALLQLAPILERYIADLYWSATKGTKEGDTRLILRDLLLTMQLNSLLGLPKIRIIRSLIGTPLGLNIRNVGWHGFLGQQDFYPGYVSIMLSLTLSLPSSISPPPSGARSSARPLFRIDEHSEPTWRIKGGCIMLSEPTDQVEEPCLGGGESKLTDNDIAVLRSIRHLVNRSSFIVPHSRFLFASAIDVLFQQGQYAYYQCLVYALPALEHCLRNRYVKANSLPPQMLTAVMYEYYTTLDVLINQVVETTLHPNLLRKELGDPVLTALCDFFTCPEGPRLRDRISHGEAHPAGISKLLCDRVLALLVRLITRYDDRSHLMEGYDASDEVCRSLRRAEEHYDNYTSSFHTKDVLIRKLTHYFDEWRIRLESLGTTRPEVGSAAEEGSQEGSEGGAAGGDEGLVLLKSSVDAIIDRNQERSITLLFHHASSVPDSGSSTAQQVLGERIAIKTGLMFLPTLYLSSFELSAIVQLRMVVTLSARLVTKLNERYEELKALVDSRKARSRQRSSFTQLCEALPYFSAMTQCIGLVVEDRLRALADLNSTGTGGGEEEHEAARRVLQERELIHLKQLLVCVEKQLSLLAQGDKWREVCKLFQDYLIQQQQPQPTSRAVPSS